MRWLASLTLFAIATAANAQSPLSVRVLMGTSDTESTTWDGSVRAQSGTIVSVEPWRFEGTDAITGTSWKMATHPVRRFAGAAAQGVPPPVVANGVVITLTGDAASTLQFTT